MACTTFDTSKYFSGNITYQKNFLTNCKIWFEEMATTRLHSRDNGTHYRTDPVRFLELLHQQYERGVLNGWLKCYYDEFEAFILGKPNPREVEPPPRRYNPYRWRRTVAGTYRDGSKYRKNTDHKKKEKTNKEAWREHKRFDLDKTPRHWHSGSRRRNYYKRLRNRQERHITKGFILKEAYDDISTLPVDRWKWD